MTAVWMRARAELRARLGAAVLLMVVLGLFGGAAAAAVAGGRRTASAHPRFLEAQDTFHAMVLDFSPFFDAFWTPDFDAIEALPYIERASRMTVFFTDSDQEVAAPHDAALGSTRAVNRVLEGRPADPRNPEEAVIPFGSDLRGRVKVGERLEIGLIGLDGEPKKIALRIVGIVVGPGQFPPLDLLGNDIISTPAFYERYRGRVSSASALPVWFRNGYADMPQLRSDVDVMSGDKMIPTFDMRAQAGNVERSFQLEAIALWIGGGFLAFAVALVFAQALARHVTADVHENPILRSMGMRRAHLVGVSCIRIASIVGGGALLALGVMVGLSPVFPRGLARVAETDPGPALDVSAFGIAFVPIVLVTLVLLAVPILRASSRAGRDVVLQRPSRLAGLFARAGSSAPVVVGARMALEPGVGRTSVPVRSSVASVVVSVVAIVAAFTFGDSMRHMLDTPRLWGKGWHVSYGFEAIDGAAKNLPIARAHPDVEAAAIGSNGIGMRVDDVETAALVIAGDASGITNRPLSGAHPKRDEVLLAPRTLRATGKRVGDTVRVGPPGAPTRALRVVGVGTVPPMSETMQLGEGMLLSYDTVIDIVPAAPPPDELFVQFRPAADVAIARESLRRQLIDASDDFGVTSANDLVNLGRIDRLPLVLAAVLGVLGLSIVGHVLITSIRRRTRELAVLKTIGFVRAQIRRAVAWQTTILVTVSLLVAIPVGIVAGRWLWAVLATQLGVGIEPVVDWPPAVLTVCAALLFGNLIAALPARAAARTRPALALRTE